MACYEIVIWDTNMNFSPNKDLTEKLDLLKAELHQLIKVMLSNIHNTTADEAEFINSFLYVPSNEDDEVEIEDHFSQAREFSEKFNFGGTLLWFYYLSLDSQMRSQYGFRLQFDSDNFEYSLLYTSQAILDLTFENCDEPDKPEDLINHIDDHILKIKEAQIFGIMKGLKI